MRITNTKIDRLDVVAWVVIGASIAAVWLFISVLASTVKTMQENCGKEYPIDHVLNTNLFCETK